MDELSPGAVTTRFKSVCGSNGSNGSNESKCAKLCQKLCQTGFLSTTTTTLCVMSNYRLFQLYLLLPCYGVFCNGRTAGPQDCRRECRTGRYTWQRKDVVTTLLAACNVRGVVTVRPGPVAGLLLYVLYSSRQAGLVCLSVDLSVAEGAGAGCDQCSLPLQTTDLLLSKNKT